MNQQRRMARTLVSLMIAMSATALLLGYMNPARGSASAEQLARIVERAVDAVGGGVQVRPQQWQDVDVRGVSEPTGGAGLLAARRDDGSWHFAVGSDGTPVRGAAWDRQASDARAPRSIVILVSKPRDQEDFSAPQVAGIRALVTELQRQLRRDAATLPVHFQVTG